MPIASTFRDAMAFTVVAEDKIFAEPMEISPMVAGRYTTQSTADGTRPSRVVMGIYGEKPITKQMLDQAPSMGRTFGSELLLTDLTVSVLTTSLLVDGVLVLPKKGDQITRVIVPDFPILEITGVSYDGSLRTVISVVKEPT